MKYKLIVTDFDDTMYCRTNGLSVTAKTIKRYQDSGGKFAICTGRMLASIMPYIKELDITGDVAACQGSVIYDIDNQRTILKGGLSAQLAAQILKYIEKKYTHIHLYIDGLLYTQRYDEATARYENYCGVKVKKIESLPSDFVLEKAEFVEKILVLNNIYDNENCLKDLSEQFGKISVVSSSSPELVEIADLNYSKGKAIEFLAKRYDILPEQIIAIGDSLNDLTMFQVAGKSIAVENASETVKAAVDEVTISCNEGAVEKIIGKYGLGENV